MKCPKCGSENVSTQMVTETKLKKKHGCLYWITIGWLVEPILWFSMFLPMLIYKLFKPRNYKTVSKHKAMAVCQDCGKSWSV